MSNLYKNLSEVYEMMYQTFINYDEEFEYYSNLLNTNTTRSLFELGCGSGNLAKKFITNGYNYTGIDLNIEMLNIARRKNPDACFIEGDMKNFQLTEKKDACIIAGRTISFLITNSDVMACLNSINRNLNKGGIVCFDCINASTFIPAIKNGKRIIHDAEFEGRKFHRKSYWSVNENQSWIFNWDSDYFEADEKGELKKIGDDNSSFRTFTKDDMSLFLELCDFTVKKIEDRPSYAFDTFVIVAQKNS